MGVILYAVLGFVLTAAGVGVLDKPWQFFVILGLVVAIDYTGRIQ